MPAGRFRWRFDSPRAYFERPSAGGCRGGVGTGGELNRDLETDMRLRTRVIFIPRIAFMAIHDDSGAAAVSFILAFPIFLTIVGIVVQTALMVNAKMMVTQAADAAARAAVASLPDEHPENIVKAAYMSLAPLSPPAASTSSDASAVYDALKTSEACHWPSPFLLVTAMQWMQPRYRGPRRRISCMSQARKSRSPSPTSFN